MVTTIRVIFAFMDTRRFENASEPPSIGCKTSRRTKVNRLASSSLPFRRFSTVFPLVAFLLFYYRVSTRVFVTCISFYFLIFAALEIEIVANL